MTATFHYITENGTVENIFEQGLNGGRKQARKWMDKQINKWESEGYAAKQEDDYTVLFISGLNVRTIKLELHD